MHDDNYELGFTAISHGMSRYDANPRVPGDHVYLWHMNCGHILILTSVILI